LKFCDTLHEVSNSRTYIDYIGLNCFSYFQQLNSYKMATGSRTMPTTMMDLGETENGDKYYKMKNGNYVPAKKLEDGSYLISHQVRGMGCNLNRRCAEAWIKQSEKELNERNALNKRLRAKLLKRKLDKAFAEPTTPKPEPKQPETKNKTRKKKKKKKKKGKKKR